MVAELTTIGSRRLQLAVALSMLAISGPAIAQQAFKSPEEAAQAFATAVRSANQKEMLKVLGWDGRDIVTSGDAVADADARQRFVAAYDGQHQIAKNRDGSRATLVIGSEAYRFPVPIVLKRDIWMFDTVAGRKEILRRRMERNELAAIQACLVYVEAQKKFAEAGGGYAQRIAGRMGEKDGLYWIGAQNKDTSPLKELIAQSKSEGYLMEGVRAPLHGYYFKILTKQGPAAGGGAKDYVVNGKMTGGFALVAYPAIYRRLGVMTFIVSHEGQVFKKDLSWQTVRLAERMTSFNPDASWFKAEPKPAP